MGLKEDLDRYRAVGEARRQDLSEFIQYGDLGRSRPDEVAVLDELREVLSAGLTHRPVPVEVLLQSHR